MMALGIRDGDEVIVPPLTFICTATCAAALGAKVVFADIDPGTLCLNPEAVEEKITPRTKAIVPVHFSGLACDLDGFETVSNRHGIPIVYDAAHAVGAKYSGKPIGGFGKASCYSFQSNKNMTTLGEGGAVTTNDQDEHGLLMSLRNQGRLDTHSWLMHGRLGYNYRLDDLSAALGIGQLEKLDRILGGRRAVAERYNELLAELDVETPIPDDADHERSWFVYVVKLPSGIDRDAVIGRLAEHGVASAPYLPSIHLQDYMRERYGFREGMLPVSEECSRRTLALPFHARLDADDQEYVVESLRRVLQ